MAQAKLTNDIAAGEITAESRDGDPYACQKFWIKTVFQLLLLLLFFFLVSVAKGKRRGRGNEGDTLFGLLIKNCKHVLYWQHKSHLFNLQTSFTLRNLIKKVVAYTNVQDTYIQTYIHIAVLLLLLHKEFSLADCQNDNKQTNNKDYNKLKHCSFPKQSKNIFSLKFETKNSNKRMTSDMRISTEINKWILLKIGDVTVGNPYCICK